jgi:hypothetical protein
MAQGVYTGRDRRQSVRFPINVVIKVEHESGTFEARGVDFNDDAVSIEHDAALAVGTAVTIFVTDELGNDITMLGQVARASEIEGGRFTMVIQRAEPSGENPG